MVAARRYEVVPVGEVPRGDLQHSDERGRGLVLVVHDEVLVADCMATLLRRAGFAVRTAYEGISALELALAVTPDLLVSDVGIRGMDGIKLAMAIVNAMPQCKVLLFSNYEMTDGMMSARAKGYDFPSLAKPVHPADMMKRVAACFASETLQ
jgi:CheY-like chemotaxis protein